VPDSLRGTVRVVVRCSSELAARARRMAARHDRTLAEILESGVADYEARPRPLTPDEEDAAARADVRYDRMREEE
jgi:hypothetical protein